MTISSTHNPGRTGPVRHGHAGAFAGQDGDEVVGRLDWRHADGRGASVLTVNIQPGLAAATRCSGLLVHCAPIRSTDGSILTTYDEQTRVADGVGILRVAILLRPDDTRVVLSETDGYQLPHGDWKLTRPQPPLGLAQLRTAVQQPWWGAELPTYFLDQGKHLKAYEDLG